MNKEMGLKCLPHLPPHTLCGDRGAVSGETRRDSWSWDPGDHLQGQGRAGRAWGAGQATHKRFSSPRPRKAPGCTVLMTLFLRSLWEASGSPHTSPTLGATCSPGVGKLLFTSSAGNWIFF